MDVSLLGARVDKKAVFYRFLYLISKIKIIANILIIVFLALSRFQIFLNEKKKSYVITNFFPKINISI